MSDAAARRLTAIWIVAAAVALAALAAGRLWLIPVHVSFNPNEGWNAFQAARALGTGGPLYPPPDALTGDNYPPLSFLVVGGAGRLAGLDPIVAGRILAAAGLLATAASAGWAVRRLEPAPTAAPWLAGGVVLGFAATQFRAYLAMDDPQWLAHALMTPALPLLLPSRPDAAPGRVRTAAAAGLVVAGLLVKHNLLALPLAATVWLAWRHRAAFAVWAAVGAGLTAVAAAAVVWVYGPDVIPDVLGSPRHGSAVRMLRASLGPLLASAPLMAATAGLLRGRRADPRLDLVLLFAAAAVVFGVLQRSGEGVNFNAHFEALVALAIGCGAALSHALASGEARRVRAAAAWVAVPFVVLAPLAAAAAWREACELPRARAAWTAMQDRIASAPGPVACEQPALCFWAGRPFLLDVFLYGQRLAAGGDDRALRAALAEGRIAFVQRERDRPRKAGDAPNPLLRRLDAGARTVFTAPDGRRLEVPRA